MAVDDAVEGAGLLGEHVGVRRVPAEQRGAAAQGEDAVADLWAASAGGSTEPRAWVKAIQVRSASASATTAVSLRTSHRSEPASPSRRSSPTMTIASPTFRFVVTPCSQQPRSPLRGARKRLWRGTQGVPRHPRAQVLDGLEGLGGLAGAGDALHPAARGDVHRVGGHRGAGSWPLTALPTCPEGCRARRRDRCRRPRRAGGDSRSAGPARPSSAARRRCRGRPRWRCAPGRSSARRRRRTRRRSGRWRSRRSRGSSAGAAPAFSAADSRASWLARKLA